MINWNINIGSPILGNGMAFQVRYRKIGIDIWTSFLPNPTTNEFTIPNLAEGDYEAEIRTVCQNGSLSQPVFHTTKITITPPTESYTIIRIPITWGVDKDGARWWNCMMIWSDILNKTQGTIKVTSVSDIYDVKVNSVDVSDDFIPINSIVMSSGNETYEPYGSWQVTEPLEGHKHNVTYRNGTEVLYFQTDLYIAN